jgi:hypothetical protein
MQAGNWRDENGHTQHMPRPAGAQRKYPPGKSSGGYHKPRPRGDAEAEAASSRRASFAPGSARAVQSDFHGLCIGEIEGPGCRWRSRNRTIQNGPAYWPQLPLWSCATAREWLDLMSTYSEWIVANSSLTGSGKGLPVAREQSHSYNLNLEHGRSIHRSDQGHSPNYKQSCTT